MCLFDGGSCSASCHMVQLVLTEQSGEAAAVVDGQVHRWRRCSESIRGLLLRNCTAVGLQRENWLAPLTETLFIL